MSFVNYRPNSWVSQQSDATTQLTYALQLNPSPLTISTSSNTIYGGLEFVITNPDENKTVNINWIQFKIQVGSTGDCLTTTTYGVKTNVSDSRFDVKPPGTVTGGPAEYTLLPVAGSDDSVSLAGGASVVVQIYNFETVPTVGTTEIDIKEDTDQGAPGIAFDVTTFPSGFTFRDLTANVLNGSNKTPVAQVANGTPVTLTWNSSVAVSDSFQIYYSTPSGQAGPITPTEINTWTSPPLSSDTVFTLVLTQSDQKGTPLVGSLSTAVSVVALPAQSCSGANITCPAGKYQAGTLSVDGGTILSLGFWANSHWFYATQMYVVSDRSAFYAVVNTGTSDVTWNPVLLVAPIEGKTPTVDVSGISADPGEDNGGITVTGDLIVSGSTNAQAITTTGLTVSGATNAQSITATGLTVNGDAAISGSATVNGAISGNTLNASYYMSLRNVTIGHVAFGSIKGSDASIITGSNNFTAEKVGAGQYLIRFQDHGPSYPVITITPHDFYLTAVANVNVGSSGFDYAYINTGYSDQPNQNADIAQFYFLAIWS